VTSATQDFASLYVTPGVRLKAFPKSRISPYLAIGSGYADYEQSTAGINGQPNPASREPGPTDSLRASTVNHTAGLAPSPSMIPPATGALTQCS
jgi:hypothetical protein